MGSKHRWQKYFIFDTKNSSLYCVWYNTDHFTVVGDGSGVAQQLDFGGVGIQGETGGASRSGGGSHLPAQHHTGRATGSRPQSRTGRG